MWMRDSPDGQRITYAKTHSHATTARLDPSSSREAAAIKAAKMVVSNAQGEYEQLERERLEEEAMQGKRPAEAVEDGAGKRVKVDEDEMEIEMEDDEDGESRSSLSVSAALPFPLQALVLGASCRQCTESQRYQSRMGHPTVHSSLPTSPPSVPRKSWALSTLNIQASHPPSSSSDPTLQIIHLLIPAQNSSSSPFHHGSRPRRRSDPLWDFSCNQAGRWGCHWHDGREHALLRVQRIVLNSPSAHPPQTSTYRLAEDQKSELCLFD